MKPYYADDLIRLFHGDALEVAKKLDPKSVQTVVTSPPYFGLRDYGVDGQLGAEGSVREYVDRVVELFRVLRDAVADDGTVWLNLGDSYSAAATGSLGRGTGVISKATQRSALKRPAKTADLPEKNLLGVPWRVALALQADGWILRSDIIWAKPNGMPESIVDRPTRAHEYVFMLSKTPRYVYDIDGYPGGGIRSRSVWSIPTQPTAFAHFATMPSELARRCIRLGSRRGDVVLDPFSGSGTTGMVATEEGRRYVGIDINDEYLELSLKHRFAQPVLDLTGGIA